MEVRGIDISHQYSKSVDRYRDESLDYPVTMHENEKAQWPVFPDAQAILYMER